MPYSWGEGARIFVHKPSAGGNMLLPLTLTVTSKLVIDSKKSE